MRRTKYPAQSPVDQAYRLEHVRRFATVAADKDMYRKKLLRAAGQYEISPSTIAAYWLDLALADVRELTPQVNCRYCWGTDNLYQYTKNEFIQARRAHLKRQMALPEDQRVPFDEEGGDGYDRLAQPNLDCPECRGVGKFEPAALNLNKLSRGALLLYDGVIVRKDGTVEIKHRDRTEAMKMLQRVMGFEVERKMVLVRTFDPTQLQDEELVHEIERLQEDLRNPPRVSGNLRGSRAGTEVRYPDVEERPYFDVAREE